MFFTQQTRQDKLNSVIARYQGNMTDKQMKFLSSEYPQHGGTVMDREYKILGDLGYVGSWNDRWNAYLKDLGGSGLESLDVIYKTFYGAAGYLQNDIDPEFVADFRKNFFRKDGQGTLGPLQKATKFSQVIDHSATSNATMTGDYGPELVTNGDFSNGSTGWTLGTGWTISGGAASCDGTNGVTILQTYPDGLTDNAAYEFTFTVSNYGSGNIRPYIGGNNSDLVSVSGNGVYKIVSEAGSSNDFVGFQSSATNFTIDNISVREVPKIQWRPHNLLTYSEDFSASAWSKTATTVTANAAVAPDGTQTADKISHTSTSAEFRQTPTTVSGAGYVNGIFIKYIDHQWFRINLDGTSFWFDAQNGVIGTDNTSGASVTALSDDWWYVTAPITAPDTSFSLLYYMVSANNSTTEVSGTSAYIWGAHLYRSDLGGMADVPADARVIPTATKYVRTAGRVIGSELVTNGTFDSDVSGWTDESGSTTVWSSGAANQSTTVSGQKAYQAITCEVGKVYQVSATFSNATARADLWVHSSVGAGTALALEEYVASGTMEGSFVATAETMYVQFGAGTTAPQSVTFDNISVKEIDVNPASARYLPRRGHHVYNGSQWVNKGLLHESEARTNLVTYSIPIGAQWQSTDATITQNSTTAPDGTLTATKITEGSTASFHFVKPAVAPSMGASPHTVSCYLKSGTTTTASLFLTQSGNNGAIFDLDAGIVLSVSGTGNTATIEDAGNGWYRCAVTNDGGADLVDQLRIGVDDGALLSSNGDGTSSIYAWGFQVEQASTPSSYIPTSGSAVTRAAESLTIPAANLPWPSPVYVTNTELVTNGTFDTDLSGWTDQSEAGGSIAWNAAGIALTTGVDGTQEGKAFQAITTAVGKVYRVTATRSGAASRFDISTSSLGAEIYASPTTTSAIDVTFTATSSTTYINVRNLTAFNSTAYIDNISVKEINPLALSIQMSGEMTYADGGTTQDNMLLYWAESTNNRIYWAANGSGTNNGLPDFRQVQGGVYSALYGSNNTFLEAVNQPFNIASRHGSTFLNGAIDGVALTANTTPVALPDLSSTDLSLGHDFMGTIDTFRVWAEDIGNTGIAEATEPSEDATLFLSFDGTETSYIDFEWSE